MHINISPEAAAKYKKQIEKAGGIGIRIVLVKVGCSGWAYRPEMALGQKLSDEHSCVADGVTFFASDVHLKNIDGLSITVGKSGLRETVKFSHPNIANSCGCGESVQFR